MDNKETVLDFDKNNIEQSGSLLSKKPKNNLQKNDFKDKECKVIKYDKFEKTLDVLFGCYGIRIFNVKNFSNDIAVVKYKGEIGKPNFEYRL